MSKSNYEIRDLAEKTLKCLTDLRKMSDEKIPDWKREEIGWDDEQQAFLKENLDGIEDALSRMSDSLHDVAEEPVKSRLYRFSVPAVIEVRAEGVIRADSYSDAKQGFWDAMESNRVTFLEEYSGDLHTDNVLVMKSDDLEIDDLDPEEAEAFDEDEFSDDQTFIDYEH